MSEYKDILKHIDKYIVALSGVYAYHQDGDEQRFNLFDAIDIIKELLAERAWHPYPAEKPPCPGKYLVTALTSRGDDDPNCEVMSDYYFDGWETNSEHVIAWREEPEPYKVKR